MKVQNVYENVLQVLKDESGTRNDDSELYIRVCEAYGCYIRYSTYSFVCELQNTGRIPSYDSVTRARRKAQERFAELRASNYMKHHIIEKENEYRDFSKEN